MSDYPRVAFFFDSYHGVDGVATTCRNIVETGRRRGLPILSVQAGSAWRHTQEGAVETLDLPRGPVSVELDTHLKFDLLFSRHYEQVMSAVKAFGPDVVHVTGPGDVGITGVRVAQDLDLPLVAAWHTNVHEFAGRRVSRLTERLPQPLSRWMASAAEESVLSACLRFYQIARVILVPNAEQMRMVTSRTGKPVFAMRRGVNTYLFSPSKRSVRDRVFRLGYVGRLRPEKNVRFLAELEQAMRKDGMTNYRFLIVGEGDEREWLERKLIQADFTGELHGDVLAQAYANMDLFVFPSETDTFGNVVMEAMASGTPAIVTSKGGPKFQVRDGVNGFVAADSEDFFAKVKRVMRSPVLHRSLREASRAAAVERPWEAIWEDLREAYEASMRMESEPENIATWLLGTSRRRRMQKARPEWGLRSLQCKRR